MTYEWQKIDGKWGKIDRKTVEIGICKNIKKFQKKKLEKFFFFFFWEKKNSKKKKELDEKKKKKFKITQKQK
jgi:hypothetical protein